MVYTKVDKRKGAEPHTLKGDLTMMNAEPITFRVSRHEALSIMMAVQNVIFSLQDEGREEGTTEDRKQNIKDSIEKRWQPLLNDLHRMFDAQDEILKRKYHLDN